MQQQQQQTASHAVNMAANDLLRPTAAVAPATSMHPPELYGTFKQVGSIV
jgi:hypothetical protein